MIRFLSSSFLLTSFLLFSCGKKEQKDNLVVQSLQQTGHLVTVEYTLSKIVKATDNRTWYKLGDRRLLIAVEAVVKAGVDLQHIAPEHITIQDSSIHLNLPSPTVFSVSLPPDKIRVLYEDVSFFRSRFTAAEREALLRQAESQIRALTDSLGILTTARVNAETFLRNLLQQGGYKSITIKFAK